MAPPLPSAAAAARPPLWAVLAAAYVGAVACAVITCAVAGYASALVATPTPGMTSEAVHRSHLACGCGEAWAACGWAAAAAAVPVAIAAAVGLLCRTGSGKAG